MRELFIMVGKEESNRDKAKSRGEGGKRQGTVFWVRKSWSRQLGRSFAPMVIYKPYFNFSYAWINLYSFSYF